MRKVSTVYNKVLILNLQSSMRNFRSECTTCLRLTPTEDVNEQCYLSTESHLSLLDDHWEIWGSRALIPWILWVCRARESLKAKSLRNLQLAAANQNAGNAQWEGGLVEAPIESDGTEAFSIQRHYNKSFLLGLLMTHFFFHDKSFVVVVCLFC